MDLPRGTRIDGWFVERKIGEGSSASVYEVRDEAGARRAAKVLTVRSAGIANRFRQEAMAQALVVNDHVIRVDELTEVDGAPVLIMELVDGLDLHGWLRRYGPFPIDEGLNLFRGVLDAVAAAHAAGMVHRDLKPSNVLLVERPDGPPTAKVTDFGLVKDLRPDAGERADARVSSLRTRPATQVGVGFGTPAYMSPEQLADASTVDLRTDIFALGALLYEILVGTPAFRSELTSPRAATRELDDLVATIRARAYPPPSERVPGLPARVDRAIRRMLDPNPDARPRSCVEVETLLFGTRRLPEPALETRRSYQQARFDLARAETIIRPPPPRPSTAPPAPPEPAAVLPTGGLTGRQASDLALVLLVALTFAAGIGLGAVLMGP